MSIEPRHLQYLYPDVDLTSTASYTFLPWCLGLLTATTCPPLGEDQ
ncbi:hypothetical protein [Actinoplanes derwentensis]|nr:hypothetical protein [Actinoplanes derwentensis]